MDDIFVIHLVAKDSDEQPRAIELRDLRNPEQADAYARNMANVRREFSLAPDKDGQPTTIIFDAGRMHYEKAKALILLTIANSERIRT